MKVNLKMSIQTIRVLHYIKHMESGGGETLLYNLYRNINRENVQFDYLTYTSREELLDSKMKSMGAKKVVLLKKQPYFTPLKILSASIKLYKLLKNSDYKIIHVHCSNGQGLLYCWIAKIAGIPIRIVHIHNVAVEGRFVWLKRLFHDLCKMIFIHAPTDYFACSKQSAMWLYSKNIINEGTYRIIKNGIDLDNFANIKQLRSELITQKSNNIGKINIPKDWVNKKIILSIGRMEVQKNQIFLLDVFKSIIKKSKDFRLILIGKGSLEFKIKQYAKQLDISDKVLFVSYTDDVKTYMMISDLFLLPSLSEGLGIVAIESQAAGLRTIVSDAVPKDVFITDLISAISLKYDADYWADSIIRTNANINGDNIQYVEDINKAGYNIKDVADELENFYMEKYKKL